MSGAQPPPAQRSDSGAADDVRPSLAHRAFLRHAPRPFRGNELLARNGGDACVAALVDGLYDGIEQDRALRPLFNRDLSRDRANQKVFFTEWLGGEARYSERAYRSLQHRHDDLPITAALADRWLGHFRRSLERAVSDPADREEVFRQVQTLALALVHPAPAGVAWCGIEARTLARAATLARRGGVVALRPLLATTPGLTSPTYAARLLQYAALAGRADAVALLIEHHVDVDKPHYLETGLRAPGMEGVLFVTPLCAARWKHRERVVAMLHAHGARDDIFSAAFLGDGTCLDQVLRADPALAQATDPATDVLDITPLHHAVAGRQSAAVHRLLRDVAGPLRNGARALECAVGHADVAMVEALLAHGADATHLGAGRWVLHPTLAPLLAARGARIDDSGTWIGLSCTGNQHRKDDPDYVQALLRHGAAVSDRRAGATALHYAAKAGFLATLDLLLAHGAEPRALDARGRTPLDWLADASPNVARAAVRQRLTPRSSG